MDEWASTEPHYAILGGGEGGPYGPMGLSSSMFWGCLNDQAASSIHR